MISDSVPAYPNLTDVPFRSNTRSSRFVTASWSKGKATAPAQVPSLRTSLGLASTYEAKIKALKEQFFPVTEADLSDL